MVHVDTINAYNKLKIMCSSPATNIFLVFLRGSKEQIHAITSYLQLTLILSQFSFQIHIFHSL